MIPITTTKSAVRHWGPGPLFVIIWARERNTCIVSILSSVARVFIIAWRASANQPRTERASAERKGRGTSSDQICSCSRGTNPKVDETESIDGRRRLELPATQGDEAELEDIVKIGQVGGHAKLLCSTSVLL